MSTVPVIAVRLVREGRLSYAESAKRPTVRVAADAARIAQDLCGEYDREALVVLCLDIKHRVIGAYVAALGTLDSAPLHPREVFKAAILANAAAVILAHNHPSGNLDPSPEDHRITQRLKEAGTVLGIGVLDHIILGAGRYASLMQIGERGQL